MDEITIPLLIIAACVIFIIWGFWYLTVGKKRRMAKERAAIQAAPAVLFSGKVIDKNSQSKTTQETDNYYSTTYIVYTILVEAEDGSRQTFKVDESYYNLVARGDSVTVTTKKGIVCDMKLNR